MTPDRSPSGEASVLAIVGVTASGKSELAMRLAAERADIEIVAVDAFTIYRGMDIGTAKPPEQDRQRVPHHLIDVLAPTEDVSVATFQQLARAAIEDILDRSRTPLLVGGSGLYFRAVVDDLRFPPTDQQVRDRIEAEWVGRPQAAHQQLASLDPDAAARIEPGNLRRTVRALEVIELTGERFSGYAAAWDAYESIYEGLDVTYLEPEADLLRVAIERRSTAMVEAGLVAEMLRLRQRHVDPPLSRTARQAIGYSEAAQVLDRTMDESELASLVAQRTWNYARRQRSWFRRDPRCIATSSEDAAAHLGVRSPG